MHAQGSQQVSLLTNRPIPGSAAAVRGNNAGVAQLVEHLFCKQVVSGSIPLASSSADTTHVTDTKTSEGCPSGQREQAVNLPAHAYVGSNPTPSTAARPASGPRFRSGLFVLGSSAPPRGNEFRGAPPQVLGPRPQNSRRVSLARRESLGVGPTQSGLGINRPCQEFCSTLNSAGVTQLVESQFSKLKVDGSSPFSRSKSVRVAFLRKQNQAHLAQLVEHVLGKDEVISSNLMVGSNNVQPQ